MSQNRFSMVLRSVRLYLAERPRGPRPRGRLYRFFRFVLSAMVMLFLLLLLTFVIGRMLPVDPVLAIVGRGADQATYMMVKKELGLASQFSSSSTFL